MAHLDDLVYGLNNEERVLKILKKDYGNVKKYKDKYAPFDFYLEDDNGNVIREWELKTRRVEFGRYPSLIFGYNKMEYLQKKLKTNIDCKFSVLFLCSNGLYEWKYNEDEYYVGQCGNYARGEGSSDCCFIQNKFIQRYTKV